jgi:NAD(P)-dependent dehydrogenase (short-subunit alcohol dehydrogenase family)
MGSLSGRVAIVTGASNGIGRAIAERLAEDGAIVVVNYNHSYEKAKQVVTGIHAKGGKAVAVQSDMSPGHRGAPPCNRDGGTIWRARHPRQQCRAVYT